MTERDIERYGCLLFAVLVTVGIFVIVALLTLAVLLPYKLLFG